MSSDPLFKLGQVVATPGCLRVLAAAGVSPLALLEKHVSGDWGDLGPEDYRANQRALRDGSRLLSAYALPNSERIWIITEAQDDNGVRNSTCLLLPGEY